MIQNSPFLPFTIRRAPIVLFLRIAGITVLFDSLFLIVAFLGDAFLQFSTDRFLNVVSYDTAIFIILIFIQLFWSFLLFLHWFSEYYQVDQNFITHRRGIIFPEEERHMIDKVESLSFSQKLWGRVFEYGDVKLSFTGGQRDFSLPKISNPRQIIYLIEHRREK